MKIRLLLAIILLLFSLGCKTMEPSAGPTDNPRGLTEADIEMMRANPHIPVF